MRRLFWIGVGAVAAVVVIRKAQGLIDEHTPPGVAQAVGVVGGVAGRLRAARDEFSAGLTERETELRHDLLGDVDLDEARARTDSWRADRKRRAAAGAGAGSGLASAGASDRRGRHSDPSNHPSDDIAQDPSDDDGDLGYSFY